MASKLTAQTLDTDEGILSTEEVRAIIAEYEKTHAMSSEEFLRQWEAGTAPDTRETNDWAMLLDWVASDSEA